MVGRILILLISGGLLLAETAAVERAWQLAANGQPEQAIHLLSGAIQQDPNDPDARLLLGSLLSEAGRRDEAFAQLNEAVRLRPRSSEAQNALGEAYSSFGYREQARQAFEKAAALDPQSGIAQLNLGRSLLEDHEPSREELNVIARHLDRAIGALKPDADAATAHYLRAKVYTQQGNAPQAEAQLQEAVSIRADFPEAWSDLGEARKTLQNDAGATAAFEKAVKLNANDPVAQYRLGEEYLRHNRAHLAVMHLEQTYRLTPDDQSTLNALQRALRQDGRPEEADQVKRKLAQVLRKRDEFSQNELAATRANNEGAQLQKDGNLSAALEKYRAALALNPASVPIQVNLAIALLRLGQWTNGLNQLHDALLRDVSNTKIRAALRDAVAQAPPGTVPHWKEEPVELTVR
ncbi:MAG TPA: tetratricopeptide repeat protein [Bryobacteraceae bacterium]|jgi:tetratricopeptide (TPR) repeat protein